MDLAYPSPAWALSARSLQLSTVARACICPRQIHILTHRMVPTAAAGTMAIAYLRSVRVASSQMAICTMMLRSIHRDSSMVTFGSLTRAPSRAGTRRPLR